MNNVVRIEDYNREELLEKAKHKKTRLYREEVKNFKAKQKEKQERKEKNAKIQDKFKSHHTQQSKIVTKVYNPLKQITITNERYLFLQGKWSIAKNRESKYACYYLVSPNATLNVSDYNLQDFTTEELIYFIFTTEFNYQKKINTVVEETVNSNGIRILLFKVML
jgi:hypothetical protein